jgi:hypothetical protein
MVPPSRHGNRDDLAAAPERNAVAGNWNAPVEPLVRSGVVEVVHRVLAKQVQQVALAKE